MPNYPAGAVASGEDEGLIEEDCANLSSDKVLEEEKGNQVSAASHLATRINYVAARTD